MRMTMRLAYATVNPVTIMQPASGITARWPFAAVLPVGASAPAGGAISVIQAPPYPYTGAFMTSEQAEAVEAAAAEEAKAVEEGTAAEESSAREAEHARRSARKSE